MSVKNIKVSKPTYRETVPSTGQEIKIHPFKVADEKVLLLAAESKDETQMVDALKQVVASCTDDVDVNTLAFFDLEYIFLKLRACSVGEAVDINVKCTHCEKDNSVSVDLNSVVVVRDDKHTDQIKIGDNIIFKMKYADINEIAKVDVSNVNSFVTMVAHSIKEIYHDDEVHTITLADISDVEDLLNDLPSQEFQKVQEFFSTQPKVKKDVEFVCQHCSEENKVTVEGLANFF